MFSLGKPAPLQLLSLLLGMSVGVGQQVLTHAWSFVGLELQEARSCVPVAAVPLLEMPVTQPHGCADPMPAMLVPAAAAVWFLAGPAG